MRDGIHIVMCISSMGASTLADSADPRILENLKSFSIGPRTPIESHAMEYGLPRSDDRIPPPALH